MKRSIFRKTALNRLSSPDQLDQLMQVTSPRDWIALAAFALLLVVAMVWSLVGTVTTTVDGEGVLLRGNGVRPLPAPCDGIVTSFIARSGVEMQKGEPMVVLTPPGQAPMKVESPFHCRMLNRNAKEGDEVKKDSPLMMLENLDEALLARLFIPVSEGYKIESKMSVQIWPANVKKDEFGYLKGHVVSAAKFPITRQELVDRLQNEDLARELSSGGPKLQIIVQLIPDPDLKSGYRWSTPKGPPLDLFSGTPCQSRVIIGSQRPIHLVFPGLGG